jgi:transketolase
MRTAFIKALCDYAATDERVWLLTGDLGYSVLEQFADRFPERFVNVGVAEQNMTGVAAGLAMSGRVVVTYSIANFPVMRCLEQIRNDVCYHNLSVKVVAVGGGLAYGTAGYSHHALEDLAVMRSLPNMTVLAPGDPVETRLAVRAMLDHEGPVYLRLGKAGEPVVHATEPHFALGRAIQVREGTAATLISTGGMLKSTVEAADLLAQRGFPVAVFSMPSVKPLDREVIAAAARATPLICTVEEHGRVGGLGEAVASIRASQATGAVVRMFAVDTEQVVFTPSTGGQAFLVRRAGLTAPQIAEQVADWLLAAQGASVASEPASA